MGNTVVGSVSLISRAFNFFLKMMGTWYIPSVQQLGAFLFLKDYHTLRSKQKKWGFYWVENFKVTAFKTRRNYTKVTLHTPTCLSSL